MILFGGALIFSLLTLISLLPESLTLANTTLQTIVSTKGGQFYSILFSIASECLVLVFAICFITDGFRRIKKSLKQGECVSNSAITVLLLVYFGFLAQCIGILVFCLAPAAPYLLTHPLTVPIFYIIFDAIYAAGISTLATILFRLGADQAVALNSGEKFERIVEEELTYSPSLNKSQQNPLYSQTYNPSIN
jgi:hypothetical protein